MGWLTFRRTGYPTPALCVTAVKYDEEIAFIIMLVYPID